MLPPRLGSSAGFPSALEADQVLADVHGVRALRHSTVKLASSEGFARDFLPAAVRAFLTHLIGQV